MTKPLLCRVLPRLLVGAAIAMTLFALSAGFLGVDTDEKWGPFRKGSLGLGVAGLVIPLILRGVDAIDRRLLGNQWPYIDRLRRGPIASGISAGLNRIRRVAEFAVRPTGGNSPTTRIAMALMFAAVGLLYVGLVSVWHWTTWPATTNYYAMLADAFIHGQTALLTEPSPVLAELQNPYALAEAPGVPYLLDVSYFSGKYYLYFGPAPALFAALWTLGSGKAVGDQHIVFAAVSLTFTFAALIVLYLKRRYFPSLPGWLLAIGLIVVASAHPMLWFLNSPFIYEAAISSGQAFLLAGLYFALPVLDGSQVQPWRLVTVGVLWSLALWSRLTLAGPVAVFAIAAATSLFSLADGRPRWKQAATKTAALGLPLAIGIGLLGLYNYIRFGSFLEPGFRYALSSLNLTPLIEKGELFNLGYLLPNLTYYLFAPIRLISVFPFIRPIWDHLPAFTAFLSRFDHPAVYTIENMAGMFLTMPTIVLAGYLLKELLCGQAFPAEGSQGSSVAITGRNNNRGFRRTVGSILLAGFVAAVPMLMYYHVAMRFLLEWVPLLAIAAAVGAWRLSISSRPYPIRRALSSLLIVSTVVVGTLVSFLLALTGADSRFDDLNPVLYQSLVEFFSRSQ